MVIKKVAQVAPAILKVAAYVFYRYSRPLGHLLIAVPLEVEEPDTLLLALGQFPDRRLQRL
jgi:hypothetical protein